jgi:predicted nucleic acid-binding Zn ribbon protein
MARGQPQHIGNVLSQLMARRGYARVQSATGYADAWRDAAGPLAEFSRATQVRRGVLEVLVSDSTMVQEISFQKPALLKRLVELLPDDNLRDLKLRVGPMT